jgi:transposase
MTVPTNTRWFGVDVSKATFDISLDLEEGKKATHRKFPRTPQGSQSCLAWVDENLPPGLVPALVMEATGGYSRELAFWLLAARAGMHVCIAQPVQVHHFAKMQGQANKTDALDAILLARFGAQQRRPIFFTPMSPAYTQLRALTRERAALVKALVALRNRNELPSESTLAQGIREQMLEGHRAAIAELDQAIQAVITAEPELAADSRRLQTIPGVGPVVAATVMGELGDLRDFPHPKALTAFVGVAPALSDSGSSVHEPAHMTKQGSSRVRQVLYLAAMAAIRKPNTLSINYEHLLAEGKAPMSALGAVMRKLLVLCRAVLLSGEDYDPQHVRKTVPTEA